MNEMVFVFGIGIPVFIGFMYLGWSIYHAACVIRDALRDIRK